MADPKITGGALPAPQRTAPSAVAREAQRAFFDAALRNAAPAAQVRPATSAPERPVTVVQATVATRDEEAGRPTRLLRPGSFLDIKV